MSNINWKEDELAKCPFYTRDATSVIVCESPVEYADATTALYTTPAGKKKDFMNKYCRGLWETCPIARDVMRKYESEES